MKNVKKLLGVFVLMMVMTLCVPNNVRASEMSDEFKSYLNKDGKLVVNSVRVESGIEFVFEYLFVMDENGEYINSGICWDIAEDMNSVDFTIHCDEEDKKETHNVEIAYTYDEKIKSQVDGYLSQIPENLKYFEVRDLEVINYWVNGGNPIDYSSHLKSMFDYKNFKMDFRAGGGDRFVEEAIGNAQFMYNGTVYGIREHTGISVKHVLYIDESVGNTEEEIVKAVQKRIDDYIGKGKVRIEFSYDNVYDSFIEAYDMDIDYYQEEYDRLKEAFEQAELEEEKWCRSSEYDNDKCMEAQNERGRLFFDYKDAETYLNSNKQYKETFIENWNDPNSDIAFLRNAVNNWSFAAYVDRGDDSSQIYEFVVIKDGSKMVNPSLRTSDVATDVEISTNSTLPLDTTIQANKLTSGAEYERILKILNLTDNLTFDLKLYSDSTDKYITKLEDGTFEVKIPVPENFEGKDLVVYYVNEDGETEEYKVEIENGYAVFKTTHFSIYTLGYTETINDDNNDTNTDNNTNNDNNNENNNTSSGTTGETEENPKTFDGVGSSIAISIISLIGLVGTTIYLKKRNKVRA